MKKITRKEFEKWKKSAQVQGEKGEGGTEMTAENLERHIKLQQLYRKALCEQEGL